MFQQILALVKFSETAKVNLRFLFLIYFNNIQIFISQQERKLKVCISIPTCDLSGGWKK